MLNLGTVNVIKINKIINLLNKVSRSKVKVAYKEILNKELLVTKSNTKKFVKMIKYYPKLILQTLKSHI